MFLIFSTYEKMAYFVRKLLSLVDKNLSLSLSEKLI